VCSSDLVEFLKEMLRDGPVKSGDVTREAKRLDISERTLRRARATLKVKSGKIGSNWKQWLPGTKVQLEISDSRF